MPGELDAIKWVIAQDRLAEANAPYMETTEAFSLRFLNVGRFADQYKYFDWYHEVDEMHGPYKLVLVHPGSGKTTKLQEEVIRRIAKDRRTRVGFISKTAGKSKLYMGAVGHILKNHHDLIKSFGPFFSEDMTWNTQEIRVIGSDPNVPTPTITNLGIAGQVESLRFNLIVADDPVDIETSLSGAETTKFMERLTILEERLEPGGEIWILGRRFCLNDAYQQIIEQCPHFQVKALPAIRHGRPLAHERWTLQELEAKRANMPEWKWQTHYMQISSSPSDASFEWAWVQNNIQDDIPENRRILAVVDPAYSTDKKADFSAGWAGLLFRDYVLFIGIMHEKMSSGWAERFTQFAMTSEAPNIHIEMNNAKTLPDDMRKYARANNIPVNVVGFNSVGNKQFRISRLETMARKGQLRFHRSLLASPAWSDFRTQWSMYPHVQHDDLLDALEMCASKLLARHGSEDKIEYIEPHGRYDDLSARDIMARQEL